MDGAGAQIDRLAKKCMNLDTYPNKDSNNPRITLVIDPDRIREEGLDNGQ